MKQYLLPACCIVFLIVSGCTAPGPKFVDIQYTGDTETAMSGKVGIAGFTDKRDRMGEGAVGKRALHGDREETFFVQGMDLAGSVTRAFKTCLEKSGFDCREISAWEHSPQGVKQAGKGFEYIIGGDINKFECFAEKKAGTVFTIDIDIVVYLGSNREDMFKRIPVALTIERRALKFSKEKLETFFNEALSEVIAKALPFAG